MTDLKEGKERNCLLETWELLQCFLLPHPSLTVCSVLLSLCILVETESRSTTKEELEKLNTRMLLHVILQGNPRGSCMLQCSYRGQRMTLWGWLPLSTFTWVLGIEPRLSGLHRKCLYMLSHLISISTTTTTP